MKKIIALFIATILLVSALAFTVSAAGATATIVTDKASYAEGDTVKVSVSLAGLPAAGIAAFDPLTIKFDPAVVEYVGKPVAGSGATASEFAPITPGTGEVKFLYCDEDAGTTPIKTAGNIITFEFKALKTGAADFTLSMKEGGVFCDPDGATVEAAIASAPTAITITEKTTATPTTATQAPSSEDEDDDTTTTEAPVEGDDTSNPPTGAAAPVATVLALVTAAGVVLLTSKKK